MEFIKTFQTKLLIMILIIQMKLIKKKLFFLGLALSIDSFCVGLGSGIIGFNDLLLPIFVSVFQLFFINCSANIANLLLSKFNISDNILSYVSSFSLILLGTLKILF